jgi:rare lipoprotein A
MVEMSTRVRRLGLAGLALLTCASVVRTSFSLASTAMRQDPNLNFRLAPAVRLDALEAALSVLSASPSRPSRPRLETREVVLAFKTLIRSSGALAVGETRVVTEGTNGRALATYRVRYRGERGVSRTLVSYVLLASPLPRVVLRGSAAAVPVHTQYGQASWYECPGTYAAHLSLPFGTVVSVENLDNGQTVTVVINDRGPYGIANRIIDLCVPAFATLAPLAQGVARVKITW